MVKWKPGTGMWCGACVMAEVVMEAYGWNVTIRQSWSGIMTVATFTDGRGKSAEGCCPDTAPARLPF